MNIDDYLNMARQAALRAYCPYSGFHVGCALVGTDGQVFLGCNIESASYSATICAERVAASASIAQGVREWDAAFIVSPTSVSPCGVCRQFLFEFAPELKVYLAALDPASPIQGPIALKELLPWAGALQQSSIGRKL
ncbi:MAG: cytidine deaminase [Pirellula sp.]|jgi:cytidine deaminase|nr:cytidine deaminase [Pirellula sp.]